VVIHASPVPEVQNIILLHTGPVFGEYPVYVVPRAGSKADIVLGGTLGEDADGIPRHFAWSSLPKEPWEIQADADAILRMCRSVEPRLTRAKEVSVSVGYRPSRKPGVRVEPEFTGPLAGRLIHNYGHGGGGVTLSWGCAREAANWIDWSCS
jgi:D-amino-acid oxidase